MAFRVPAKRRRPSSVARSKSSNVSRRGQSFVAGSSPTLRPQGKKYAVYPSARRVSLRTASAREESVLSSSHSALQHWDPHLPSTEQLDAGISPERDAEIDEREEDDSMNEVVMAVDLRDRGTVGCTYYVAREQKLYMTEDVRVGGIEVISMCMAPFPASTNSADPESVKLHAQPTVILLSTKVDESVDTFLEPNRGTQESANGGGAFRSPHAFLLSNICLDSR